MKLSFDCGQIVKDVRVIKLEVIQNHRSGSVVDELAALVKKGGVEFVCFNDKVFSTAQTGRHPKVQWHPAYQKTRLKSGLFEDPGQHRGGGCFAMGACHRQNMTAMKYVLCKPLRSAGEGGALIQDGLHQWKFGRAVFQVGTADHVTDHIHVGLEAHLAGIKAFNQINTQGPELVTHWGINAGIATGNLMARLSRQGGQSAHEAAANT